MTRQDDLPPTAVLLSFHQQYNEAARTLTEGLTAAGLEVRPDAWQGGGGAPSHHAATSLDGIACVLPFLTPAQVHERASGTAAMWIGHEWELDVHARAVERNIPVLPVRGAGDPESVPKFLLWHSYADLGGHDAAAELLRLIRTIRDRTGDNRIRLPALADDHQFGVATRGPARSIILEAGARIARELLASSGDARFRSQLLPMMADGLFYELGVQFPKVRIRKSNLLPEWSVRFVLNDIPESVIGIPGNSVMVNETTDALIPLGIPALGGENPANGLATAWVAGNFRSLAEQHGLTAWDVREYVVLMLSAVLRRRAADFVGVDQVRWMLRQIKPVFPMTIAEAVPDAPSLFLLTDVLRRLLAEEVSIRNLRRILMSFADWRRVETDPTMLTEYARAALKRYLSHKYTRGQKTLTVLLVDPGIETKIREGMRHIATGSFLDLGERELTAIMDAFAVTFGSLPPTAAIPCILTTMEVRAALRRLLATRLPNAPVLSYQELSQDIDIQPIARLSLQHPPVLSHYRTREGGWAVRVGASQSS